MTEGGTRSRCLLYKYVEPEQNQEGSNVPSWVYLGLRALAATQVVLTTLILKSCSHHPAPLCTMRHFLLSTFWPMESGQRPPEVVRVLLTSLLQTGNRHSEVQELPRGRQTLLEANGLT